MYWGRKSYESFRKSRMGFDIRVKLIRACFSFNFLKHDKLEMRLSSFHKKIEYWGKDLKNLGNFLEVNIKVK